MNASLWIPSTQLMPTCLALACLAACEPAVPIEPTVIATEIADLRRATPVEITPEQAAEKLALGTTATSVQRERLREQLLGSVVEWELTVYEISLSDSGYYLVSRTIQVADSSTLDMVSVHALVLVGQEADRALLETLRTGDVVRLRGRIQDVLLRSVVVLAPAVVAPTDKRS